MKKTKIIAFILTVLVLGSSDLFAQNKLPSVAVVSLDLPVNRSAEQSVLKTLANANVNVISPEELQERLNNAKSSKPSKEIAGKFAKMSVQISKGVEKFFYESEKKAIKNLQPVFDLGMNNIQTLARRADYADQIFQAGIILIRAYEIRNQKENAASIVRLIVGNFPTQPFSASVIPPKVIKRLEKARADLGESGTTIELVNRGSSSQCVAYLNGFAAPLNSPIPVKADTTYHIRLDCGVENQVVWKTSAKQKENLAVPLTSGNPLIIGISSDDLHARQMVETALQSLMFWAHIDHIVGVSENFKEDGNVLVVRIQSGKNPHWSDGANKEDVHRALVRVFPELELETNENITQGDLSDISTGGSDWLGWALVGSGLASASVGVVLWASTLNKQKELECGYGLRSDCEGIPEQDPNSADFKADQDAVDTRILASYILYGVGGVLAGYGLFRIITHDPKNDQISISPIFSPSGVGVQMHTRF